MRANGTVSPVYGVVMERVFAVLRSRGPAWDDSKPLEGQVDWTAHAAFMDNCSTNDSLLSRDHSKARATRS